MTYHLTKISKGTLGEISKVEEEYQEFLDAKKQDSKIMMGVELSDMFGAIMACLENNNGFSIYGGKLWSYWTLMVTEARRLGLSTYDLKKFSDITKRAFESGERK